MPQVVNFSHYRWVKPETVPARSFVCGYCGKDVSSEKGYRIHHVNDANSQYGGVFVCPNCSGATYFSPNWAHQVPGPLYGRNVAHVPKDLDTLFTEARDSLANAGYTAGVLVCRKMLMNIAVSQGAEQGLKFIDYVNYLSEKGYVPPNGKHWVDHIRRKGNEANHEIVLMTQKDAAELLTFVEMLLRFIYEFPNLVPKPDDKGQQGAPAVRPPAAGGRP